MVMEIVDEGTRAMDPTTIGRLPRLPCCSVLLRLYVNPGQPAMSPHFSGNTLTCVEALTWIARPSRRNSDESGELHVDVRALTCGLTARRKARHQERAAVRGPPDAARRAQHRRGRGRGLPFLCLRTTSC
eukprot:3894926-Rhodomonas_salina.1